MKFPIKSFNVKHLKNFRVEFVAAILGIVLLIIPGMFERDNASGDVDGKNIVPGVSENKVSSEGQSYAETEAKRLEDFLEKIKGVGDADVLIYVDTSSKTVNASEIQRTEENTEENDSNGGKRVNSRLDEISEFKVIKDDDGNESLVHIYDEYPEIKGILISAEGADSNVIKETIIEAVACLYDIPVHKVSVVKKTGKN